MRALRQKIKLLEEGSADEDAVLAAKARYFKTSDEYARFSKAMDLPQQRERVSIDGLGFAKSVEAPAANAAVRNTGKILEYNPKADFNIKLEGYSKEVLDGLSKASGKVAEAGGKDNNEHLALVNLKTGAIEYEETGTKTAVGGKGYRIFIKNNPDNDYAFVHNHNTDGYFSEMDMNSLLRTKNIKSFIAVRLDGVKYIAEKKLQVPDNISFDEFVNSQSKFHCGIYFGNLLV